MARKGGKKVISQQLELPQKTSGEVDWDTLGNILTARIQGEILHASYVDPKYGKSTGTFPADTEWRYVSEEREIVILKKRLSPDSPLWCFMGRGVIDMPMQKVADFFRTPLSTLALNPFVEESRVLENLSDVDYIGYVSNVAQRCLVKAKRDFVYYMHYVEKDGQCIKSVLSIEHQDCPPLPGITRGQFRPGSGWVLEKYKGDEHRTLVSVLAHLDLVGIPPVISNMILKRLPLQIYNLKKHLLKPQPASNYNLGLTESLPAFSEGHFEDALPVGLFTGREHQHTT